MQYVCTYICSYMYILTLQLHSERVSEILQERENEIRREKVRRTSERIKEGNTSDDENSLQRIWSKAKGFASQKKTDLQARYTRGRDDEIELLDNSTREETRVSNSRSGSRTWQHRNEPNKGIFDDI